MKGTIKTFTRLPHLVTSKVGMSKKSNDPEYDDYERKYAVIEQACDKLLKDAKVFREAVLSLLVSGDHFAVSFAALFSPMGSEYDLIGKNPQAEVTIKSIGQYKELMEELRNTLSPELELIDSRIIMPSKELTDILKKIRKTMTKRDHKLVDYDRHNNSLTKLRDKKEKSLNDEKNLFKYEQDFEAAAAEYEHYNNQLKTELPQFLTLGTRFIDPLFHSFYFMQLNVFYLMLEKIQSFADGKYDLARPDFDNVYDEQLGDVGQRLEGLEITQRQMSTAKMMAERGHPISPVGRASSVSSSASGKPPVRAVRAPSSSSYAAAAPPAYEAGATGGAAYAAAGSKRAPPPPPPLKPKPSYGAPPAKYAVALFDFEAQAAGDLGFSQGDRIEVVDKVGGDWWTGKVNGKSGVFPGNYVQEE